ncbi:1 3-beta-glucanosyltransferase gel4 [Mycoemilia scoparia]|uniref:1,3-beta-glucanosyltransferase n=1 Tax=Mycoemilia scoparia TaxID=417184 RepID=A0A9W8DUN3_9FUNG|nr:1 3-beta-glucanosyltransferase gel4 [Mycoemilia scoparia]
MRTTFIVGSLLALLGSASAINKLEIKGSKFFDSKTGEEFFFKGIAYQPEVNPDPSKSDPLADVEGCKRDLPYLKELGVNSVRVYQTDPSKNHDECMKMLADNGIYVMLDLAGIQNAINRNEPQWDSSLLDYYYNKVDAFGKYGNLAAFIAGNEVANSVSTVKSAEYVKAAVRDTKAYIKSKNLAIPVGYASNDEPELRDNLQTYFDCGDEAERVDFYGVNLYQWCGDGMDFKTSGYESVVDKYKTYAIPVLLTEYGCNAVRPRTFPEVKSIYGSDMTGTFSGGFMYMYSEEANNYGVISVGKDGSETKKTDDFDNFKNALSKVDPKGVNISKYSSDKKASQCPKKSDAWPIDSDTLPPTPKEGSRPKIDNNEKTDDKSKSKDKDSSSDSEKSEDSEGSGALALGRASSFTVFTAIAAAYASLF